MTFSILSLLFLTAQTCQFGTDFIGECDYTEPPTDQRCFTESYQSCLESKENYSRSSTQGIVVGLKDNVDLDDFVSDYNLEPYSILRMLQMVDYPVEDGTQAEWICLFLEDERVTFAELEGITTTSLE